MTTIPALRIVSLPPQHMSKPQLRFGDTPAEDDQGFHLENKDVASLRAQVAAQSRRVDAQEDRFNKLMGDNPQLRTQPPMRKPIYDAN